MQNIFCFSKEATDVAFTDRRKEIERIKQHIRNSIHFFVVSPRRMGKTWLLTKVSEEVEKEGIDTMWIDISSIATIRALAKEIVKGVFLIAKKNFSFENPVNFLKMLPVEITQNINMSISIKGVSVDVRDENVTDTIIGTLKTLDSFRNRSLVVFDEFQDIATAYPEFLNALRSVAQHSKHISYAFMGSKRTMMEEIFSNPKSIMYHMGAKIVLGPIPEEEMRLLIRRGFSVARVEYEEEAVDEIVKVTEGLPYYAQYLGYYVLLRENKKITKETVKETINVIIDEDSADFDMKLSMKGWKYIRPILSYISHNGSSKGIYASIENVNKGTISYYLNFLEKEEILYKDKEYYKMTNPFFRIYIRRKLIL